MTKKLETSSSSNFKRVRVRASNDFEFELETSSSSGSSLKIWNSRIFESSRVWVLWVFDFKSSLVNFELDSHHCQPMCYTGLKRNKLFQLLLRCWKFENFARDINQFFKIQKWNKKFNQLETGPAQMI